MVGVTSNGRISLQSGSAGTGGARRIPAPLTSQLMAYRPFEKARSAVVADLRRIVCADAKRPGSFGISCCQPGF
jgi:hypothetical protein